MKQNNESMEAEIEKLQNKLAEAKRMQRIARTLAGTLEHRRAGIARAIKAYDDARRSGVNELSWTDSHARDNGLATTAQAIASARDEVMGPAAKSGKKEEAAPGEPAQDESRSVPNAEEQGAPTQEGGDGNGIIQQDHDALDAAQEQPDAPSDGPREDAPSWQ
jgi:hypothetical protein